ncbi:MAG: hypothetical protein EPGJADBJ_01011 [Saprospiraceae bacterium]|nr:hypothetical protein [Saprospiraceae bacterium]
MLDDWTLDVGSGSAFVVCPTSKVKPSNIRGLFQAAAQHLGVENRPEACSAYHNGGYSKHLFEDVHIWRCFLVVVHGANFRSVAFLRSRTMRQKRDKLRQGDESNWVQSVFGAGTAFFTGFTVFR